MPFHFAVMSHTLDSAISVRDEALCKLLLDILPRELITTCQGRTVKGVAGVPAFHVETDLADEPFIFVRVEQIFVLLGPGVTSVW